MLLQRERVLESALSNNSIQSGTPETQRSYAGTETPQFESDTEPTYDESEQDPDERSAQTSDPQAAESDHLQQGE